RPASPAPSKQSPTGALAPRLLRETLGTHHVAQPAAAAQERGRGRVVWQLPPQHSHGATRPAHPNGLPAVPRQLPAAGGRRSAPDHTTKRPRGARSVARPAPPSKLVSQRSLTPRRPQQSLVVLQPPGSTARRAMRGPRPKFLVVVWFATPPPAP